MSSASLSSFSLMTSGGAKRMMWSCVGLASTPLSCRAYSQLMAHSFNCYRHNAHVHTKIVHQTLLIILFQKMGWEPGQGGINNGVAWRGWLVVTNAGHYQRPTLHSISASVRERSLL
jgi:hypothetical protein